MPIRKAYGAVPDTYDPEDEKYQYAKVLAPGARPDHVDLEVPGERIWDQGQLGSCWENACAAEISDIQPGFELSRLWLYYKARVQMGHGARLQDSGTASRPALSVLLHQGVPPESEYPYSDDPETFLKSPPRKVNTDAHKEVIEAYRRIVGLNALWDVLGTKRTCMIGIYVYEGFESDDAANTGKIPLPGLTEAPIGAHEVQAKGLHWTGKPDTSLIKFRNSWHNDWGDRGYGYLPFTYYKNEIMDAYVIDGAHPRT
jgi:hypothetical protein